MARDQSDVAELDGNIGAWNEKPSVTLKVKSDDMATLDDVVVLLAYLKIKCKYY
jgi:hypothetical protein